MNESDDSNCLKFELDCAVCLQKCNHPTQLPCGHVFCFLCVKGIAFQSKKCAMCRAEIPPTYLDNPILLGTLSVEQVNINPTQELYQWFYEGRNGWWKYDERSNFELESAFNAGDPDCTLLLAGTLYNIDFQSMTQVRRSDQTRRRRVRRDTPMFPSKGIAGIKTDDTTGRQVKSDDEESPDVVHVPTEDEIIEISDDETNDDIEPILTHQENVDHVIDRISQAILADKTLYVSGVLGMDPQAQLVCGGAEAQARQALDNLRHVLEAGGASLESVVKTTILLARMDDFQAVNQVYAEFFPKDYPARATFQVGKLPLDAAVEIEAIALSGDLVVAEAGPCPCAKI